MSAQYDLEPLRDAAARLVAARVTVQAWTETVAHHTREAYTAGVREAELQRVTGLRLCRLAAWLFGFPPPARRHSNPIGKHVGKGDGAA